LAQAIWASVLPEICPDQIDMNTDVSGDGGTGAPFEPSELTSGDPRFGQAPMMQEWADVLDVEDEDLLDRAPVGRGQVLQITAEVEQDENDDTSFKVDGKDKSWFLQKGAVTFKCDEYNSFSIHVTFCGGKTNKFGDDYAELSRAEQHATMNWLIMIGIAARSKQLTGYKDCKSTGFYFLFHLNYRRTHWRIIGCPHNSELEDTNGKLYTCNPQDANQFELPAYEGQSLTVEYHNRELWVLENGSRVVRGHWAIPNDGAGAAGALPDEQYVPAILTSNCPTHCNVRVSNLSAT